MTAMEDAGRAFEIMRRRKCWPCLFEDRWIIGRIGDEGMIRRDFVNRYSDPVAAILAFDEAERRAGR